MDAKEPQWLRFSLDGEPLVDISWPPHDGEVGATRGLLAYEHDVDEDEIHTSLIYEED